ncbi:xanthine dehydrogenase [Sulfitobacter pacificus]|uniref:Xanthine dehydrogenase n=1 Tax=Sulfitobacter pacificus TaxID=1499314 RepID=A0ABQ5VHQ0_9RHOB|nr:xanthine dehydrogenase [Sulfitobacter pacificus]
MHIIRMQTIEGLAPVPYVRPSDLETALSLASQPNQGVIAGGTDVFPASQQGQRFQNLLDLTAVRELAGITLSESGIRIGAAARWRDVIDADLPAAFDGLKQAARQVGSVQIQNSATVAGNLCNASPAADGVPPLLTLDASVEVASAARGIRRLPLDAFILGVRQTALQPDEIMTAIMVPTPPENAGSSFEKLGSRTYLVISIAMVAALVFKDAGGRITFARIAVGACSPVAQRLRRLEVSCIGKRPEEISVTADHLADLTPIDDVRGSAAYRLDAVAELCQRAVKGAAR